MLYKLLFGVTVPTLKFGTYIPVTCHQEGGRENVGGLDERKQVLLDLVVTGQGEPQSTWKMV